MRILVLHPAARDHGAALGQRRDDAVVGVALLAVVVDDARALEAGGGGGVEAGIVDDVGDGGVDAALGEHAAGIHPDAEVVEAVAGRGVDEAGTGVVGDVLAIEQRDFELVAASQAAQRMAAVETTLRAVDIAADATKASTLALAKTSAASLSARTYFSPTAAQLPSGALVTS